MLVSRGQENLLQTRPAAGKALQPKTPGNVQTPRNINRAPLGAKTTNAKAQTVLKDQKNAKFQVFKTPAPNQQIHKPEKTANRPSTARKSARSKLTVASPTPVDTDILTHQLEDDETEFGYAPPPIVELPDPPMDFDIDETFPQFRPENMFRGYGEIFHASPKDENGFSMRLKKEEEEHREWMKQEERKYDQRMETLMSKKWVLPYDDPEDFVQKPKVQESKPDTIKARSAASALSSMRLPSAATKQTASSKLKTNAPLRSKTNIKPIKSTPNLPTSRPLTVSKNTIGFPKAKRPPAILPQHHALPEDSIDDADTLADDLSDFEFSSLELNDGDDLFQLPMPEE